MKKADNFDLRKYLVENKVTTNSRMLNETTNIQDIMSILRAGDFAALAKIPGDQKLAQTILNTLKQSQPELLKKLAAYTEKNQKMLNEGALKNTLLGLLMAGILGLGIGAATSGGSSTAPKSKAPIEKSFSDDYADGTYMLHFYKNNKEKINKLAQGGDYNAQDFQSAMQILEKNPDKGNSEFSGRHLKSQFKAVQDSIKSQSTAKYK